MGRAADSWREHMMRGRKTQTARVAVAMVRSPPAERDRVSVTSLHMLC